MKKYSTSYFEWFLWTLVYIFLISVFVYGIYKGLTYEKKYSMDFIGYTLTIGMTAGLGLMLWEEIILIDFILKDINGEVYFDTTELIIKKGRQKEVLKFKDLRQIEFVNARVGSKSITSYATHCKLGFGDRDLILTSFTISNNDIIKELGRRNVKTITRERKYFELIK